MKTMEIIRALSRAFIVMSNTELVQTAKTPLDLLPIIKLNGEDYYRDMQRTIEELLHGAWRLQTMDDGTGFTNVSNGLYTIYSIFNLTKAGVELEFETVYNLLTDAATHTIEEYLDAKVMGRKMVMFAEANKERV